MVTKHLYFYHQSITMMLSLESGIRFVGFCRFLSGFLTSFPVYNRAMELLNKYIPPEYLALKINYCRQQLVKLPDAKLKTHKVRGVPVQKIVIGNKRYNVDSELGKKYMAKLKVRDYYKLQLPVYESVWNSRFKNEPFPECRPHKVIRKMFVEAGEYVVMDKAYFDSLKNDADTKHEKKSWYPFNGIYYRSAAERDIAIYYTEMGIPFKYEPEVYIKGLSFPIYPDFIIYIKELDCCKIHEHLGVQQSSNYNQRTKDKYINYTNAGLIPDLDVLFTYDTEDMPFDIRGFVTKLNNAVYTTAISTTAIRNVIEEMC